MSVIPAVLSTKKANLGGGRIRNIDVVSWSGITAGDTCEEFDRAGAVVGLTIVVSGVIGGSDVLAIKGRNLSDEPLIDTYNLQGQKMEFSAGVAVGGGGRMAERFVRVQPVLDPGVDVSTEVSVSMVLG
jgi:hypothetical protein